jgi:hypothetical protein
MGAVRGRQNCFGEGGGAGWEVVLYGRGGEARWELPSKFEKPTTIRARAIKTINIQNFIK